MISKTPTQGALSRNFDLKGLVFWPVVGGVTPS